MLKETLFSYVRCADGCFPKRSPWKQLQEENTGKMTISTHLENDPIKQKRSKLKSADYLHWKVVSRGNLA